MKYFDGKGRAVKGFWGLFAPGAGAIKKALLGTGSVRGDAISIRSWMDNGVEKWLVCDCCDLESIYAKDKIDEAVEHFMRGASEQF